MKYFLNLGICNMPASKSSKHKTGQKAQNEDVAHGKNRLFTLIGTTQTEPFCLPCARISPGKKSD